MGVILAKFRREKSTQAVLEALQEKIDALETFTVNTQEQKKRIVGNFLAVSIGIYVIAFVAFYFIYFPPTWKDRIVYCVPLLLFPIIIILLRYLFTWYFQRKLNKNSKKLTALRAEKKKILEQVMDKETYKVAVNLLARFADKPSTTSLALSASTPHKNTQPLNHSLPARNITQRSQQLTFSSPTSPRFTSNVSLRTQSSLGSQMNTTLSSPPPTALMPLHGGVNQQLRRRTPFPIVNQQEKGVFDRIVDVLIGDGPQDRFAMICKECNSHNGMALKDDFEYTTYRCAFCNALNPSRKIRPVAPRLSVMPSPAADTSGSDTSDSEGNRETVEATEFNTPTTSSSPPLNNGTDNSTAATASASSENDEEIEPQNSALNEENEKILELEANTSLDELLKQLEKSDSAIADTSMSPE